MVAGRFGRRLLILMAACCQALILSQNCFAASGSDAARRQEEIDIRAEADRHVESGASMMTSAVIDIYRDNKGYMTAQEIAEIYENEYQAKSSSIWRHLGTEGLPWLASIVLFVLLLLRDSIANGIKRFLDWGIEFLCVRFAGMRVFRARALRKYRQCILERYETQKLVFRQNKPLNMRKIFVPLALGSEIGGTEIDAVSACTQYRRLMVIGAPGSGKSILLKHILMRYADGYFDKINENNVAILFELHRLNTDSRPIIDHLADALDRHQFRSNRNFLERGLKDGVFLLLFDGLDEVFSDRRNEVIQKLKDFLQLYDKCRAVVTCRTVVYDGELAEVVDATLTVIEFSDHQIRRFLQPWEADMSEQKSVNQLMQTLRDRPRIMVLARNPLLLTIIAYLYTDTNRVLPQSRAEFYRLATSIFLDDWHQDQNNFQQRDKRSILRALALSNQDSQPADGSDRLSVLATDVYALVRKLIPDFNLPQDQEPGPIIAEIVRRSGLLLEVDGGERIQFAHLTLQEFFAAEALLDDPNGLLARFKGRPNAWRETVKLWCGLAADSTKVIAGVRDVELHTAFECLGDAAAVEVDVASDIIQQMEGRLQDAASDIEVARAFATLASGQGPRNLRVFSFLLHSISNSVASEIRQGATIALSLTNMSTAASYLAAAYDPNDAALRSALVRMGDIGLPALEKIGQQSGEVSVLEDIFAIGTPEAALCVGKLVNGALGEIQTRAAWCLAALLPQPGVEAALESLSVENAAGEFAWVWAPFGREQSNLGRLVAKICRLIAGSKQPITYAVKPPDTRLAVPIAVELLSRFAYNLKKQLSEIRLHKIRGELPHVVVEAMNVLGSEIKAENATLNDVCELLNDTSDVPLANVLKHRTINYIRGYEEEILGFILRVLTLDSLTRLLLCGLPFPLRLRVFQAGLRSGDRDVNQDWMNYLRVQRFKFGGSMGHWLVALLTLLWLGANVAAAAGSWLIHFPIATQIAHWLIVDRTPISNSLLWNGIVIAVSVLLAGIVIYGLVVGGGEINGYEAAVIWLMPLACIFGILVTVGCIFQFIWYKIKQPIDESSELGAALAGLALFVLGWSVVYVEIISIRLLFYYFGHFSVCAVMVGIYVVGGITYFVGNLKEKRAKNPLHNILRAELVS